MRREVEKAEEGATAAPALPAEEPAAEEPAPVVEESPAPEPEEKVHSPEAATHLCQTPAELLLWLACVPTVRSSVALLARRFASWETCTNKSPRQRGN